jgi:hypothetical protein
MEIGYEIVVLVLSLLLKKNQPLFLIKNGCLF